MKDTKEKDNLKSTQSNPSKADNLPESTTQKTERTNPVLFLNTFNELVKNTTEVLDKVNNIIEIRAEIERIRAQAEIFIKALELDHQKFLEREKNAREYINQLLANLDRLQQKILDKALGINLSSCNEQEYNFLMTVLNQIEKFTFRLMDTIDKYLGEK